jgi:portal protein
VARDKKKDSELLEEIRDEFKYYEEAWRDIREEARHDMRCVAGDPWDEKDRQFREDNDRPCMTWDEINPYINKLVNDPRQNKRSIQVDARGAGASDKTAEFRGNLIREICYNSKAQSAFTTGFQGAVERSYGFWRIGSRYVTAVGKDPSTDAFNQELYVGRIPNPDCVLFHPLFKEMDASDAMGCFVLDRMRVTDFKRKYPNAEKVSFTTEDMALAPQWIFENKEIQVAEYWKVSLTKKTLHLLDDGGDQGAVALYEDELPDDFDVAKSENKRDIETRVVTQYITNGVEILDEAEIEIPWIPIVPVFGKEIYVHDGGGSTRKLISLTRMARDPFMAYCYYRSQEAEEAGMTPKVPFIGYVGQFKTHQQQWQDSGKIPISFLQADIVMDATGTQVLPLPTRQPFTPNFQAYEVACEAARRAIQTAMSGSILPTQAGRRNEKSGVALKEIDSQEDEGTFHYIDNYNQSLEHTGRILDAWIPYKYDTKRDVGVQKPDQTHQVLTINDPDNVNKAGESEVWDATIGEHGVTISVGPNEDSQREAASEFVDTLIQNLQTLPLAAPQAAKLLSLAITLKNIGPIGKEMSEIISPPPDQAAQQQAIAQGQQQLQQQQEVIQQLQEELQKLQLEKAGKVIQGETQKQLATINNDVKVLIAEVQSQQQNIEQRQQMFMQYWTETHGAAHEVGMQANQQAHEKAQAAAAAQQAAQSQQSDQQAASAQSAQDHGQAQQQQVTAAALAPKPEPSTGE